MKACLDVLSGRGQLLTSGRKPSCHPRSSFSEIEGLMGVSTRVGNRVLWIEKFNKRLFLIL